MYRYFLLSIQRVTAIFFLESEKHRNGHDGYSLISHIPNKDPIVTIFPKRIEENKYKSKICMFLKKGRGKMNKHQFDEYFTRKYFEKQFKPIMLQRVFTLPDFTLSDTDLGRSNRNPVVQAPF